MREGQDMLRDILQNGLRKTFSDIYQAHTGRDPSDPIRLKDEEPTLGPRDRFHSLSNRLLGNEVAKPKEPTPL
jgi:hypothetical protein